MNQPTLLLFTKKPLPNQVKTRFLPDVSAETAADIALEMIIDTVEKATTGWPGQISLLIEPDVDHPALLALDDRCRITLGKQVDGDLGTKMEAAIRTALHSAPAAAVMGCDIPTITPAILELAFDRLREGYNVMGPSADGGFYFAGFTRHQSGMFNNIEWSTPTVFEITMSRLQECKIPVEVLLPCLNDMDCWTDFVDFAQTQSRYAKYLSASRDT